MAEFNLAPFLSYCAENGIAVPPAAPQQLALYGNLLLEWNQKINLTAITDPQEIVLKHFTDCAALLRFLPLKPGQSLIDVGTGAGEEAAAAANAAGLLGGSPAAVQTYTLPGELERAVVTVKKISQTSAKYPRASAKITKQPL